MIRVNARLFAAAAVCVTTEETRYYLMGVYIEPHHERGVTLTATDGHRLVCIHDVEGECSAPAIVALPDAMLAECIEWVDQYDEDGFAVDRKSRGADRTLTVNDEGKACIVGLFQSDRDCRIDGKFPDWRKIIPKIGEGPRSVPSFNGKYIAAFARVAELLGDSNDRVRIVGGDKIADPALVLFARSNAFGVIMPTRDDGDVTLALPAFIQPPTAQAAE